MNSFITIQIGARRSYAVPSILAEAGMLEAFYTDLCADAGLGALLSRVCPDFLKRGSVKNLLDRRLPSNLHNKVNTHPTPVFRYLLRKQLAGNNLERAARTFTQFQFELGDAMIRRGLGQATHLYTMLGEGTPFLRFAKERGLTTITDIIILLNTHYIINFGFPKQRCFVVPTGANSSWFNIENHPVKGRVLFVGTAQLRKGIHIFGMAAQKLSHRSYEFRVAGGVSEIVRQHSLTEKLSFLGRVPRCEIKQEYAQADIFVLPTLAEGSAGATYEALAAGVPVITTEAAGSVVRDGIDGFIVPEGDAEALADRIEELVENRELRDRMAAAARERAKDFTWERYAERLLSVVKNL